MLSISQTFRANCSATCIRQNAFASHGLAEIQPGDREELRGAQSPGPCGTRLPLSNFSLTLHPARQPDAFGLMVQIHAGDKPQCRRLFFSVGPHHAIMKTYLLLATCMILVGCNRPEQSNREVLAKLETIKNELATKRGDTVRWGFANKREIDMIVFQWSRDKIEANKMSEALPPETEAKILEYETLKTELLRMGIPPPMRPLRVTPGAVRPESPQASEGYEVLSKKVAEAKAPIATIVDRRERQAAQYRNQYSTDKLIAEYVKDRFDLIVDSSDERFSRSAVLYRTTGEVLDITDAAIKLFKEKAKP